MDDRQFDALTRAFARGHSRRGLLKGLAGGTLGGLVALAGRRVEAAPGCRGAGHPCEGNQTCCAGLVCQASGPGAALRCTACPAGTIPCGNSCITACTASDQCHAAGVCDPTSGQCTTPPLADGTTCTGENPCFQSYSCQQGACTGSNPVVCAASDQCHAVGVCDHTTGQCTNPPKADGTSCNDGNACTQTDTCQGGVCTGSNPISCPPPDDCHEPGSCDPATGQCSNPAKPDGTACQGSNLCFQKNVCVSGTCTPSDPVVCTASDQCHVAGVCNPATGQCSNPAAADGTACDDGNACTIGDTCQSGSCVGGPAKSCPVGETCGTISCNPATGQCDLVTPAPDGTACSSGNACITGETCLSGVCQGGTPKNCFDSNPCTIGSCDATTGQCVYTPVPDGTNMPACYQPPPSGIFSPFPQACYNGQCCTNGPGNYACFSDLACCPGLRCFCSQNGCFNNSGQCLKCAPASFGCATNEDCCSGTCTNGVCG